MECFKISDVAERTGWTERNVIKRLSLGLPMPPSIKLPRSRVRLFPKAEFFAWLQEQGEVQAANDERLSEINTQLTKAKEVRKKIGRPRRQVDWDQLNKLVANA